MRSVVDVTFVSDVLLRTSNRASVKTAQNSEHYAISFESRQYRNKFVWDGTFKVSSQQV